MTALPTRRLGPFTTSALGFGCMNLNHGYSGFPSEADAARLLNRALDLGITMLDTAALYADGGNERLVARAVGHRRSEYLLASKCVLGMIDGKRRLDGSPAAITAMLDAALVRSGTERIDLYYLHRLDPAVPIEESVGALARAVQQGKIGAIGLSEMSSDTLRRAAAVHPIAAMQSEYSPATRNPDVAVRPLCRALGTALIAFSPLCRGLLAGQVPAAGYPEGDLRRTLPRFDIAHLLHNRRIAAAFASLAADAALTPAQLAIGWVLAQGDDTIALPGTTSVAHLTENVAALARPLQGDLVAAIDDLLPPGALSGARYPAAAQAQIGTELLPGEVLA